MRRVILFLVLVALFIGGFVPFVSAATQLFFDGFESGTLIQGGWNLRNAAGGQNWTNSTADPSVGTRHAQSNPLSTTTPASILWINVSTIGYTNINISYRVKRVGIDAADEVNITWFNGTKWHVLESTGGGSANDAVYLSRNWSLGTNASDSSNITLKFECTAGGATEFCRIDNVNITGDVLADTTSPDIDFVNPSEVNGSILARSSILINVSASDSALDSVIIRLYNATHSLLFTNTSLSGIFFINYSGLSDGRYYFNASANDSTNNNNHTETRTVLIDTSVPSGSYVTPTEASGVSRARSFIEINVTGSDLYLDSIVMRVYNSTHALVNQSTNHSSSAYVNISGLANGFYYYNVSINDSAGNVFEMATRNITLDTLNPLISLVYPTNTTYTLTQSLLNYTVGDTNQQACWYSVNGGTTNTTLTCGENVTGLTSSQGTNRWLVAANDSAGNHNVSRVTFFVDSLAPQISFGQGTALSGSAGRLNWIYANISANDTNEQAVSFVLFNTTSLVNRSILSAGTRTINWTGLSDGLYYYNVSINDTLGNTNWTETRNYTIDSNAPLVTGVVPSPGTNASLGTIIEIAVNISDSGALSSALASLVYPNASLVNLSLNFAAGQKYNASFSVPFLIGRYNVSFYVNDTLGNTNVTSTTFFYGRDGVAPLYANASQFPSSPTTYVPLGNYTFNITWNDDVALSQILLEFNSINYTMTLQGGGVYSVSLSNLAAGSYGYRYLANDSSNNWNSTSVGTYTIDKSVANLSFFLNGSETNLSLMYGGQVNASTRSTTSGVHLYRNGLNVTSENHLFVGLAGGQYNYTATALENQNYSAFNISRTVLINPASGSVILLLNGSASNQTGVYGVRTNASASTLYGSVTLYRNGVDVTSSNSDLIQLAAGDHNWTAVSSGNENYSTSSVTLWSQISRASGNVTLLLNGSASNLTLAYPGQVNASARSDTGSIALYRNGLNVTNENHAFVGLSVGSYNYTAFASESQNYSNASIGFVATITGVIPSLNISLSPSSSVIYPTATTVTGSGCPNELTCVLYRNNVSVSNPDGSTLGVGSYVYVYNTTGNENYSSASFSRTLSVNQTNGLVYAYVNHTRANTTLELGQSIYLNASLVNGSGSVSLALNGVLISSGSSPLSNLTTFSSLGVFNVTASYSGNENYSSSSETWFVSVVPDASPPTFSSFVETPLNATVYVAGQSYRFNVTINENYALDRVGIEFNGVNYSVSNLSQVFNFTRVDLAAGTYSYYWWANDTGGNYNTSGRRHYTILPASGNVTLLLNGSASNLTVPYLTPTNLSSTTLYGAITLLLNGADITSQNHLAVIRGAGFYNVSAVSSGDQNHSSTTVTYWLNISQLSSNVSLYLNHTRANITLVRGSLLPINGSLVAGESGISVWIGTTPIYSGTSPSYNLTNFSVVGLTNVSVFYAQSQNYSSSSETWFVNVTYPAVLELVCEIGGPYQVNATLNALGNVTFQGSPLASQLVSLGIYNATGLISSVNATSANDGGFEGTFGNISVGLYTFNASSSYLGQNATCIDSLQVGGPAYLVLDKTATIYSVSNDTIVYNISLRVLNTGASDALLVNLTDANSSSSPYMVGTLGAGAYQDRSYLINFTRGSTDSFVVLSQAFAAGMDSYSGGALQANSTILNVSVPGFSVGKHVTLVKNIVYLGEASLNVTYNVSTMLYNSGEEDLVNLVYIDADINSSALVINLTRASSATYSAISVISKAASNTQHTFALATATIDALTFYGNQPVVTIPGYGGPADALVHAPVSMAPSASFDAVLEVRNMNPDIGQDFQIDYWITNNDETVNYSSGAQTIYVPASGITNTTVNLVAPSTPAVYRLRALVRWTNGFATAYDSFEVVSSGGGGNPGGGGGGGSGGGSPVTGGAVTPHVLQPEGEVPEDVVCLSPYIRYGKECCLDQNGNAICDRDETPAETPRRGLFTGLFTFNLNEVLFVRLVDLLLILFISLAVVAFCIITIRRLIRRRKRDSTRLVHLIGMEVYTTHGIALGTVKEVFVENYRIHSFEIALHRKHHKKGKGVFLPFQFVKGVKDVILVDESIASHLT